MVRAVHGLKCSVLLIYLKGIFSFHNECLFYVKFWWVWYSDMKLYLANSVHANKTKNLTEVLFSHYSSLNHESAPLPLRCDKECCAHLNPQTNTANGNMILHSSNTSSSTGNSGNRTHLLMMSQPKAFSSPPQQSSLNPNANNSSTNNNGATNANSNPKSAPSQQNQQQQQHVSLMQSHALQNRSSMQHMALLNSNPNSSTSSISNSALPLAPVCSCKDCNVSDYHHTLLSKHNAHQSKSHAHVPSHSLPSAAAAAPFHYSQQQMPGSADKLAYCDCLACNQKQLKLATPGPNNGGKQVASFPKTNYNQQEHLYNQQVLYQQQQHQLSKLPTTTTNSQQQQMMKSSTYCTCQDCYQTTTGSGPNTAPHPEANFYSKAANHMQQQQQHQSAASFQHYAPQRHANSNSNLNSGNKKLANSNLAMRYCSGNANSMHYIERWKLRHVSKSFIIHTYSYYNYDI